MKKFYLAYGTHLETVTAIIILYKNIKSLLRYKNGDTNIFDLKTGIIQGDTLAPCLFFISLDYVLITCLDKNHIGFILSSSLSTGYFGKLLIDIDYADDLAFTADRITKAKALLYHRKNAANDVERCQCH